MPAEDDDARSHGAALGGRPTGLRFREKGTLATAAGDRAKQDSLCKASEEKVRSVPAAHTAPLS